MGFSRVVSIATLVVVLFAAYTIAANPPSTFLQAVEWLADELTKLKEDHARINEEQNRAIAAHSQAIAAQNRAIAAHNWTSAGLERINEEQNRTIVGQSRTILEEKRINEEQSRAIAEQKRFNEMLIANITSLAAQFYRQFGDAPDVVAASNTPPTSGERSGGVGTSTRTTSVNLDVHQAR